MIESCNALTLAHCDAVGSRPPQHGDTIRPAMARILAAAPGAAGWSVLQYLVSGDEGLGDARPIDLIKGNEADVYRVIRFADTLTDDGR